MHVTCVHVASCYKCTCVSEVYVLCLQDAARSHRAASRATDSQTQLSNIQTAHAVMSNGSEPEQESDSDESTSSDQGPTRAAGAFASASRAPTDPDDLLVPLLSSHARSRVMSILWANWEVRPSPASLRLQHFISDK